MPSRKRELEIKLQVPADFEFDAKVLEVSGRKLLELPTLSLSATYYDTKDLRLARHGFTLRYREDGSHTGGWTLKFPATGSAREELDFAETFGKVPKRAREILTAQVRRAKLVPVARLLTLRRRFSLQNASGIELAEVDDDRVSIVEGQQAGTCFRELEIEARTLETIDLEAIAAGLRADGSHVSAATPKVFRALGSRATDPPDVPLPSSLAGSAPASQLISAALSLEVRRLITHDPLARLGDVDGVHQMRVACRRLRSHLRGFTDMLRGEWSDDLLSELKWLGECLAPVRDMDAWLIRLRDNSSDIRDTASTLTAMIERDRAQALHGLLRELSGARYVKLIESLIDASRNPGCTATASERSDAVARRIARKRWAKLAKSARSIGPNSTADSFHRVRINAKRVRFASEMAALCLQGSHLRDAQRFARYAAQVQNVIGDERDNAAAKRALVGALARCADDGLLYLAAGLMCERLDKSARASRAKFFRIWPLFDRKRSRNWLKS